MILKSVNECVDSIIEFNDYIVFGSYDYNENCSRKGKLILLNKHSLELVKEIITTGTFHLLSSKNILYSANSTDVSSFDLNRKLIKKYNFNEICTNLAINNEIVYVTTQSGSLLSFDLNLNLIVCFKITNDPIWTSKIINNNILLGAEDGTLYKFNLNTKKLTGKYKFNEGVIDINNFDLTIISTYGNDLYSFNVKEMKVLETFKNTTSLWKTIETETGYISAAIYDGLKFFDKKFNLLNEIKTKSICYAVCKIDNRIFYSSFYQKTVYVIKQ